MTQGFGKGSYLKGIVYQGLIEGERKPGKGRRAVERLPFFMTIQRLIWIPQASQLCCINQPRRCEPVFFAGEAIQLLGYSARVYLKNGLLRRKKRSSQRRFYAKIDLCNKAGLYAGSRHTAK